MIRDTLLPPAHLFDRDDPRVVPLTPGRDLRRVLKRYRLPVGTLALIMDIPEAALHQALLARHLKGLALEWYVRMRRYEHRVATVIAEDIKQHGEAVLPRFLSDRHMAMYSAQDWALLPSARVACGVAAWVSRHFESEAGERVKIHDFNQPSYAQWLEEHALDHDAVALDFWLARQQCKRV